MVNVNMMPRRFDVGPVRSLLFYRIKMKILDSKLTLELLSISCHRVGWMNTTRKADRADREDYQKLKADGSHARGA